MEEKKGFMGNEELEIIDLKDLMGEKEEPSSDTVYDYFLCATDGK